MKPPRIKLVEYPPPGIIRVFTQAVATELSIDLYICVFHEFNKCISKLQPSRANFRYQRKWKVCQIIIQKPGAYLSAPDENDFTCSLDSEKEDFTVIKDGYVFYNKLAHLASVIFIFPLEKTH